jgi:hypothetical protein
MVRQALGLVVVLVAGLAASARDPQALTLDERFKAQRAIEEVYWRHRIWPKDNPGPKPSLDEVMPESAIRAKVEDYLRKSNALEAVWRRPITGDQLQAELDRMAEGSRDTQVLRELFDALGNDPLIVAETLARPALAERLVRSWYADDVEQAAAATSSAEQTFDAWWRDERSKLPIDVSIAPSSFTLPALPATSCTNDTWTPTSTAATAPTGRIFHSAVWTGAEMIVWGGNTSFSPYVGQAVNTGGRYTPATDTWVPTASSADTPFPRERHSATWTGREMIIWGGGYRVDPSQPAILLNTGGRYDPVTDTWAATSTGANVPLANWKHAAVWSGRELIVWGPAGINITSGGRYDPLLDSWRATSPGPNMLGGDPSLPSVWTGTEMMLWRSPSPGARYAPLTDTWSEIASSPDVPRVNFGNTAVWTGTEMIVWGGCCDANGGGGGRYDPSTDRWTPTSVGANAASPRALHTAVWTGSEMIIWGGATNNPILYPMNSGGRYDPSTDSWTGITIGADTPTPRTDHTAVWTGTEMIVWGGSPITSTGGRYCACPSGRLVYNDADGDGFGDPGQSSPSCDGSAPAGYVADFTDCNDAAANAHPGAAEICDGFDNDCNGLVDDSVSGEDSDADAIHDACDNCPFVPNATQSDFDHDGQGDACDLNDGLIWEWRANKSSVSWQAEQGPTSWNVYTGDLAVLRATGVYTQVPGSNPLATRQCGALTTVADDLAIPASGKVSFSLVTGVTGGVEGALGSSSSGVRPNANPCP